MYGFIYDLFLLRYNHSSMTTNVNRDFERADMDYDWRQKVQMPISYRIGNRTVRMQIKFVASVVVCGVFFLAFLYFILPSGHHVPRTSTSNLSNGNYNSRYPLSQPKATVNGMKYKIAIVADPDRASKHPSKSNTWQSYFITGTLVYDSNAQKATIDIDTSKPVVLSSTLSQGGRGMELSELITFNGKIYTVDDRTGVVYKIINESSVIPWVLLIDGDGEVNKGFKCEWAAVKNEEMYVGGLGKVWTTETGEVINHNPQFVKVITKFGEVKHVDWQNNYNSMRKTAGIYDPGYIIHESAIWSDIHQKWFFLPRRASTSKYDDKEDERRGTNLMFMCDENFQDISLIKIGEIISPTRGFSSFKFIPNTKDEIIIALKSEEDGNTIATYVTVFTIQGKVLYPETKIGDIKFEGIEFI